MTVGILSRWRRRRAGSLSGDSVRLAAPYPMDQTGVLAMLKSAADSLQDERAQVDGDMNDSLAMEIYSALENPDVVGDQGLRALLKRAADSLQDYVASGEGDMNSGQAQDIYKFLGLNFFASSNPYSSLCPECGKPAQGAERTGGPDQLLWHRPANAAPDSWDKEHEWRRQDQKGGRRQAAPDPARQVFSALLGIGWDRDLSTRVMMDLANGQDVGWITRERGLDSKQQKQLADIVWEVLPQQKLSDFERFVVKHEPVEGEPELQSGPTAPGSAVSHQLFTGSVWTVDKDLMVQVGGASGGSVIAKGSQVTVDSLGRDRVGPGMSMANAVYLIRNEGRGQVYFCAEDRFLANCTPVAGQQARRPMPKDTPTTPAQVPSMSDAQREERINSLLEKWESSPEQRPQIEQQLKSLRAFRSLFMVRSATYEWTLASDLSAWDNKLPVEGNTVPTVVLPAGYKFKVTRKSRLDHSGNPQLVEVMYWHPNGDPASEGGGFAFARVNDILQALSQWDRSRFAVEHPNQTPASVSEVPVMDASDRQMKIDRLLDGYNQADEGKRQQIEEQLKSLRAFRALFMVRSADDATVYHGTSADFDEFDTERGETGTHFGTPEQVNDRLDEGGNLHPIENNEAKREKHMRDMRRMRVIPADVNLANPLRLRDLGVFDAARVSQQLVSMGIMSEDDARDVLRVRGSKNKNQIVQAAIVNAGYDGIVYLNRREGLGKRSEEYLYSVPGGIEGELWEGATDEQFLQVYPEAKDSYIVFDKEQIKPVWNAASSLLRRWKMRVAAGVEALIVVHPGSLDTMQWEENGMAETGVPVVDENTTPEQEKVLADPSKPADLAGRMLSAISGHGGPVYIIDEGFALGAGTAAIEPEEGDPNGPAGTESAARAAFMSEAQSMGAQIIHFDEDEERWAVFLPQLLKRLKADGVGSAVVMGLWWEPENKTGCAYAVYNYLQKQMPTSYSEQFLGRPGRPLAAIRARWRRFANSECPRCSTGALVVKGGDYNCLNCGYTNVDTAVKIKPRSTTPLEEDVVDQGRAGLAAIRARWRRFAREKPFDGWEPEDQELYDYDLQSFTTPDGRDTVFAFVEPDAVRGLLQKLASGFYEFDAPPEGVAAYMIVQNPEGDLPAISKFAGTQDRYQGQGLMTDLYFTVLNHYGRLATNDRMPEMFSLLKNMADKGLVAMEDAQTGQPKPWDDADVNAVVRLSEHEPVEPAPETSENFTGGERQGSVRIKWKARVAGPIHTDLVLASDLKCVAMAQDSGTQHEAVLLAGTKITIRNSQTAGGWSYFFSEKYSRIIIGNRVMTTNQYAARTADIEAATQVRINFVDSDTELERLKSMLDAGEITLQQFNDKAKRLYGSRNFTGRTRQSLKSIWLSRRAEKVPLEKPIDAGGDYLVFPEELSEPYQDKAWITPNGQFMPLTDANHEDVADGYTKTIDQMILDGWIRVAIGDNVLIDMAVPPTAEQLAVIEMIMQGQRHHLTVGLGDSQDWGEFASYGEFDVDALAVEGKSLSQALAQFFADPASIQREKDYRARIDEHGYPREDGVEKESMLSRWQRRVANHEDLKDSPLVQSAVYTVQRPFVAVRVYRGADREADVPAGTRIRIVGMAKNGIRLNIEVIGGTIPLRGLRVSTAFYEADPKTVAEAVRRDAQAPIGKEPENEHRVEAPFGDVADRMVERVWAMIAGDQAVRKQFMDAYNSVDVSTHTGGIPALDALAKQWVAQTGVILPDGMGERTWDGIGISIVRKIEREQERAAIDEKVQAAEAKGKADADEHGHMAGVDPKLYICRGCGDEKVFNTNHWGDVYEWCSNSGQHPNYERGQMAWACAGVAPEPKVPGVSDMTIDDVKTVDPEEELSRLLQQKDSGQITEEQFNDKAKRLYGARLPWLLRRAGYKDWSPSFLFDPAENPIPFPRQGQRSGLWGWVYANDEASAEHGTDDLDELLFLVGNDQPLYQAFMKAFAKNPQVQDDGINAMIPVKDHPEVVPFLKKYFDNINQQFVYPTWGKAQVEPGHENDPYYTGQQWKGQAKDVVRIVSAIYGEGRAEAELEMFLSRLKPGEQEDFLEEAGQDGLTQFMYGFQDAIDKAKGVTRTKPSPKTEMTSDDAARLPEVDVAEQTDQLLDQLSKEQDPQKKQQIEQRLRSLRASANPVGGLKECDHGWPGKKDGEKGWCGRCGL